MKPEKFAMKVAEVLHIDQEEGVAEVDLGGSVTSIFIDTNSSMVAHRNHVDFHLNVSTNKKDAMRLLLFMATLRGKVVARETVPVDEALTLAMDGAGCLILAVNPTSQQFEDQPKLLDKDERELRDENVRLRALLYEGVALLQIRDGPIWDWVRKAKGALG